MLGIKLIYTVILLFGSVVSSLVSHPTFGDVIKNNYDKYVIVESTNDNYGELEIVYGIVNNEKSLSFIYIPTSQINPKVIVSSNKKYTYESSNSLVIGYGIRIKKISEVKVEIKTSENYDLITKTYKVEDLEKLLKNPNLGNGKNDFPDDDKVKNKYLPIFIILGIGGVVLIAFSLASTIVVTKYIKSFNEKYNKGENPTFIFSNMIEVKNYEEVKEPEVEEEITEEKLYEMYKKGEISYQEYLSKSRRFDED